MRTGWSPDRNYPLPAKCDSSTLRDELLRRGTTSIDGASFSASITEAVRWTLDAKTVKVEMGEAWWDARCRQSLVMTVAVKPLPYAARLAA